MSESNVVSMAGSKPPSAAKEPNKEVIEALEVLVDLAKQGRIRHFICVHSDGESPPIDMHYDTGERWEGVTLTGAMELSKATLLYQFSQSEGDMDLGEYQQLSIDDCDPAPLDVPDDVRSLHQAQLDELLRDIIAQLARTGSVSLANRLDEVLAPYGLQVSHAEDL